MNCAKEVASFHGVKHERMFVEFVLCLTPEFHVQTFSNLTNFRTMSFKKSHPSSADTPLSLEEQKAKIQEVQKLLGPLNEKFPTFCSDASVSRYLRARNWNPKKASKMLKDTLTWRLECKPEKIQWEDIAKEAETGKIYRANYVDKHGRTVLVMRPGFQNSTSGKGQIKYLVYCLENAIFNLGKDQEQMVWLINFERWNSSSISVKVACDTAHILQDYYPERLGLAILYNPPKIFESFWKIIKPFLDSKTYKKGSFVYSNNADSQKTMEDLFERDKLETAFGGQNSIGFDYKAYADQMRSEDERRMSTSMISKCSTLSLQQCIESALLQNESDPNSDASDEASTSSSRASPNPNIVHNSSDGMMQQQLSSMESTKIVTTDTPQTVQLTEPAKKLQSQC
ncbi:hypothetical protein ACLOJK_000143 [Asimina triloba]